MKFYRVKWKEGTEKRKKGIIDDVLIGREQYFAYCTQVELLKVEDDGAFEDRIQFPQIAS